MSDAKPLLLAQAIILKKTMDANAIVLVVYLVGTLGAALWVARRRRQASAARAGEEYFLAGRSLSGWQLGLSLIATTMSSVTFLGYPATSFKTNWLLLNKDFALPFVCAVAAVWVVPYYRRSVTLSVFELLEQRFNLQCRIYGSTCYCLLQLARTCTVLYLVGFPLCDLTHLGHEVVTVTLGTLIALYTVFGGFAAVVFTDVVQSVTLVGGGILTISYCVSQAGGLSAVLEQASTVGKLRLDVDIAGAGRSPPLLWLFGTSLYILNMCVYQDTAQRYCAARSLKEARVAVMITAILAIPIWSSFLLLGTALYVLSQQPGTNTVLVDDAEVDSVVSSFALTHLPPGAGGLVLAGVMAAAMSSLDSSINSVSWSDG